MAYTEVLQDKRREVVAEIERLRAETAVLAAAIGTRENQLRNLDDLLALEQDATRPDRSPATQGASMPRPTRFIDAAHEVLARAVKPMHYRALAETLADEGVYVPGQDAAANLLAHMSRDSRFGRAGGRGIYGLADWPEVKMAARAKSKGRRTSSGRREEVPGA